MSISRFMEKHYRHFNAREMLAAAKSYRHFVGDGGKMLVSLAGAMSTAELGISLAEMIRQDKVHAISCTAANLEEDIFKLFAHQEYRVVEDWRALSAEDEVELQAKGFNRVTDTCIPETVMRHIESHLTNYWAEAANAGKGYYPFEYFFRLLEDEELEKHYQAPLEESWVNAAREYNVPIFSPGIEDSTLGNIFTARVMDGTVANHGAIKSGTQQLELLSNWYVEQSQQQPIGFFQIGGGIAGDFAICTVPMLIQDMQKEVPLWAYFTQISDAVTSYGGYSGAVPNEKITWTKLSKESPKFMIQSDATIVAPLIFAYVMEQ
ncbi:MAG: deoxyhypusine synthase family protein [Pseudomonadota bacterium]